MKIIKDYEETYKTLNLGTCYKTVHKRASRVKRSFQRLEKYLKLDNPRARNVLKAYYKIYLADSNSNVKIRTKNIIVLDFMIGKLIRFYNGKAYVPVMITPEKTGHYLAEFVPTRKEQQKKGLNESKEVKNKKT